MREAISNIVFHGKQPNCPVVYNTMLLWVFTLLLLTAFEPSNGLKISGTTSSIITYSLEACPTGWESLDGDSQYNGRVIKGTISVEEGGVLSSEAAHSSSTKIPAHRHNTNGAVDYLTVEEENPYKLRCDTPATPTLANTHKRAGGGASMVTRTQEFYPAVNLNLCRLSSGDFYLPPGIIFFAAPNKGDCPTGSSSFSSGDGRLFVFASQSRSLTSSVVSPASPVASAASIGIHGHTHPPTVPLFAPNDIPVPTLSPTDCQDPLGTAIPRYAPSNTIPFAKTSNDANTPRPIGMPYVQLLACTVTNEDGSTEFDRPHRNMIFYSSLNKCPNGWEDVTVRTNGPTPAPYQGLAGRIIFNRPNGVAAADSGKVFGSPDPLTAAVSNSPTVPNHAPHFHNYNGTNGAPALSCAGPNICSTPNSIGGAVWSYDFVSSTSTEDLIPFVVLRGCSPIPVPVPGCGPNFSLKKAGCKKRIRKCNGLQVRMKWTGKGCRRNGKVVGDGGCQCKGYCGYTCKGPCVRDKECAWRNNQCVVRKSMLPGGPMLHCERET